jgi:hypothetical protein
MKEILNKRKQDGRVQYLVKWTDNVVEWVEKEVVDASDGHGCVYLFQQKQKKLRKEERDTILRDS